MIYFIRFIEIEGSYHDSGHEAAYRLSDRISFAGSTISKPNPELFSPWDSYSILNLVVKDPQVGIRSSDVRSMMAIAAWLFSINATRELDRNCTSSSVFSSLKKSYISILDVGTAYSEDSINAFFAIRSEQHCRQLILPECYHQNLGNSSPILQRCTYTNSTFKSSQLDMVQPELQKSSTLRLLITHIGYGSSHITFLKSNFNRLTVLLWPCSWQPQTLLVPVLLCCPEPIEDADNF